jgi:hypothetical protein
MSEAPLKKSRRGSETRQRNKRLVIRLYDAELGEIEAGADRTGLTLATYGRAKLLHGDPPRATRRPPVNAALLAQLLGQVGKVGGNIHQLVRAVNFGEEILDSEVRPALAAWRQVAAAIMEALGKEPHGD